MNWDADWMTMPLTNVQIANRLRKLLEKIPTKHGYHTEISTLIRCFEMNQPYLNMWGEHNIDNIMIRANSLWKRYNNDKH